MIKPIFKLNGTTIKEPVNYKELAIELNFDKDDPSYSGQVKTPEWILGLGATKGDDGASLATEHIESGLTGGLGALEGAGFEIFINDGASTQLVFDGYLDLSDAEVTCNSIKTRAVERGGIDWLNDVADGFTIDYLRSLDVGADGRITKTDTIQVPYIISEIPDTQQIFTLTISVFVITQELINTFKDWQEWSIAFSADYLTFGNLVTLILLTIKNVLLVIALIKLIAQILEVTIQAIKFKSAMFLKDICIKGAEYLGLRFESTILFTPPFNKVVLIPESLNLPSNRIAGDKINLKEKAKQSLKGIFDPKLQDGSGTYNGTFGQLLRELKTMFNAKLIINEGILRLERRDFNPSTALFKLPNIDKRQLPFRFNIDDLKSNYKIAFQTDVNDKNTFQRFEGTEFQVFTVPKDFKDKKKILTKGFSDNQIGWTLGKRKNEFTFVEDFLIEFMKDVDKVIGLAEKIINKKIKPINLLLKKVIKIVSILNKLPNFNLPTDLIKVKPVKFNWNIRNSSLISRRLGMLLLENDFVQKPKLVMLDTTLTTTDPFSIKVNKQNEEFLSAEYLWDNFHFINSFVGDNHNQGKIFTTPPINFCLEDYNKVRTNNIIFDSDGVTKVEVKSLKWNIYEQEAEITYKVPVKWTDNLKERKVINDGR